MNILSCLRLEVKEIGAKSVAFWDAPAHRIYVAFGTSPTALIGEMPCIQHYHFGAVIALHCPGGLGESPTSRPCEASRHTLFVVVILMRAWTIHYGRDACKPIVISVL
jgi:hypothetical protein